MVTGEGPAELAALMRVQIEEPAVRALAQCYQSGTVPPVDVRRFRISAERYREAILEQYETFDPAVRTELHKSLLADYQNLVNRLVTEVTGRVERAPRAASGRPRRLLGRGRRWLRGRLP